MVMGKICRIEEVNYIRDINSPPFLRRFVRETAQCALGGFLFVRV